MLVLLPRACFWVLFSANLAALGAIHNPGFIQNVVFCRSRLPSWVYTYCILWPCCVTSAFQFVIKNLVLLFSSGLPELVQLTVREPGPAAPAPLSSHPPTGQENTSPVLIVILIHSTNHP